MINWIIPTQIYACVKSHYLYQTYKVKVIHKFWSLKGVFGNNFQKFQLFRRLFQNFPIIFNYFELWQQVWGYLDVSGNFGLISLPRHLSAGYRTIPTFFLCFRGPGPDGFGHVYIIPYLPMDVKRQLSYDINDIQYLPGDATMR